MKIMKNKRFINTSVFLLLILSVLLLFPTRSHASVLPKISSPGKTYYVSVTGSDKNKGTIKKPFKTISYGISRLTAGDTLLIRKGTYNESLRIKKSGKKNKYITISSYKKEKVAISGSGKESPCLMNISNKSYIYVNGLEFRDAIGPDSCGILIGGGAHHIVLSRNKIHAIDCGSKGTDTQDCANGILLFGSSKKSIHDVWIYKNKIHDLNTGWAEALAVSGNCQKIYALSNTVKNITNIGIDFSGNYGYCKVASKDFPTDCIIANNSVTNCISPYATSYGIYVDGGKRITIKNNKISKCAGGIEIGAEQKPKKEKYSTSDITVKKNTVKNCTENGLQIGGYEKNLGWVKHVTVENNKFTNNGLNDTMMSFSKCANIAIKNNTFKNTSGECALLYTSFTAKYCKNISFDGNKFYAPWASDSIYIKYLGKEYDTFADWLKIVGKNAGSYTRYK